MTNKTTATEPTEQNPLDQRPKPWVMFHHPYADFPGYNRGDVCTEPTPEMLRVAATSGCMSIIPAEPESS